MNKRKSKVLIAEDDPFLQDILSDILKDDGLSVDTASDGEEALRKALENSYDVVLLDLLMPKKNGIEVLKELKKHAFKTPILVFSNMSTTVSREEAMKYGAKGFFVKSDMDIDEVVEKVRAQIV